MSKGNLFLGFGRGKVGDLVFSRQNGEQITRARNRSPKNPRTPLQLLQRVVMSTVSGAYSMMSEITDHSFQGQQLGTENQSRFIQRNVALLRSQLAEEINAGDMETITSSAKANYSVRGATLPEMNPYQVSEGTLLPVETVFAGGLYGLRVPGISSIADAPTYQQVVDGLGLQRGDQLTFLALSTNDTEGAGVEVNSTFNGFKFARVILDPSNGDMSGAFLSTGAVANPNVRNEGDITFSWATVEGVGTVLQFNVPGINTAAGTVSTMAAATVIVSRQSGGVWQRSTQQLVIRPALTSVVGHLQFDAESHYLGDAVLSYMDETSSSLYLNQAESF